MYRDNQSNRTRFFVGAAIFAALVFLWPAGSKASVFPEKVVFQTGDFAQVLEGDELNSWFSLTQSVVYRPLKKPEIGRSAVCPFDPIVCQAFLSRARTRSLVLEWTPLWNEGAIRTSVEALVDKIAREPENARLGMENETLIVTKEAIPGRELDVEKTFAHLQDELEANIAPTVTLTLVTKEISPKVSSSTLTTLGIKELISVGKTDFRGSPKNRIFNIKRALEQYDGLILAPGEEFSFVKFLGEVDGEHGYLPELVIKYNRTEPEFGGGICQVSTTVFRAALNAGLKITARKNHAYPVQYYKPYGMDATIYIPAPDLRFTNNTPGSLLMIPTVVGTELTFSFYGTKDGRTVEIDGPHILERNPDGSMKTIFTQIVKYENGNTMIEDKFPSSYKSPSLFPHPGDEPVYTEKPKGWSSRQWKEYKKLHP